MLVAPHFFCFFCADITFASSILTSVTSEEWPPRLCPPCLRGACVGCVVWGTAAVSIGARDTKKSMCPSAAATSARQRRAQKDLGRGAWEGSGGGAQVEQGTRSSQRTWLEGWRKVFRRTTSIFSAYPPGLAPPSSYSIDWGDWQPGG